MGLSSPAQQKAGRLYQFERPRVQWRHRLHDFLTQAMMVGGGALVAYEVVIHLLR